VDIAIKICCIQDEREASLAFGAGATYLGLVSWMPSGPGVIPDDRIREIADTAEGGSVLLTARTSARAVAEQHARCRTDAVQLVDAIEDLEALRALLPGVGLFQVLHVRDESALEEAERAAPHVDGLLLDSGNPEMETKELGGTGRTHDWSVSRRIVDRVGLPVFLAGGLHAGNVAEAVRTVRPYGVDVCSGVRTDGRLDPVKLEAFVAAVSDRPGAQS
jgi:phosphoribosylanthranilate isomerase